MARENDVVSLGHAVGGGFEASRSLFSLRVPVAALSFLAGVVDPLGFILMGILSFISFRHNMLWLALFAMVCVCTFSIICSVLIFLMVGESVVLRRGRVELRYGKFKSRCLKMNGSMSFRISTVLEAIPESNAEVLYEPSSLYLLDNGEEHEIFKGMATKECLLAAEFLNLKLRSLLKGEETKYGSLVRRVE